MRYIETIVQLQRSGDIGRASDAGPCAYAGKYTAEDQCSLVYKGRKVALYGGAYAPSYLPNDVDKSTPK